MHHRFHGLLVVLAVILTAVPAARAQAPDSGQVALDLTLSPDARPDGSRDPIVQIRHLLSDSRWMDMLRSGFPVRLRYRLEVWRSRGIWFDAFEREIEWNVVVRHEPLLDQYSVTTITPSGTREKRYAGLDPLAAALGVPYRIPVQPKGDGEFYYNVTLQVTTLSDSDLDELEQFLRGELPPAAGSSRDFGEAVGRGVTRMLLKLSGLPSLKLESRSGKYRKAGKGE